MAISTGRGAQPSFAKPSFAKIVEAKLEFIRGKDGKWTCVLHQGGHDIPDVRQ